MLLSYRLPNLNSIDLAVQQDELSPAAMSATLCSLRTQLSRLQALTLHLDQSWAGASSTWRELGRITQLTSLGISFDTDVGTQITLLASCRQQQRLTTPCLRSLRCAVHIMVVQRMPALSRPHAHLVFPKEVNEFSVLFHCCHAGGASMLGRRPAAAQSA